jgi:hypothetical protein
MSRIAVALLFTALAGAGGAAAQDAPADAPTPIGLAKGTRLEICSRMACPVISLQCDDPAVVRVESSEKGPVLVGAQPGKTLCGAVTPNYQRRLFEVTVR